MRYAFTLPVTLSLWKEAVMLRHWREFLRSENGAAGVEWAFVASILVLGSVAGLLAIQAEFLSPAEGANVVEEVRSTDGNGR
jgi:Flp pilus assembly pilin Flp